MESAAQVAMLCRALSPELVIAVDALAGAEAESLCRTVQVTDAGICPGSGVGNDRQELSRRSLGVPVISVGMPTVIDAASLGGEGVDSLFVTPADIDRLVRAGGPRHRLRGESGPAPGLTVGYRRPDGLTFGVWRESVD